MEISVGTFCESKDEKLFYDWYAELLPKFLVASGMVESGKNLFRDVNPGIIARTANYPMQELARVLTSLTARPWNEFVSLQPAGMTAEQFIPIAVEGGLVHGMLVAIVKPSEKCTRQNSIVHVLAAGDRRKPWHGGLGSSARKENKYASWLYRSGKNGSRTRASDARKGYRSPGLESFVQ